MSPQFWSEVKELANYGSSTIVIVFMLFFVLVLLWAFIRGTLSIDIKSLFVDPTNGQTSHTKYWSNVAYLSATISFLSINLFYYRESAQFIEVLWMVYLGVVASNATVGKWISYKYSAPNQQQQNDQLSYNQYQQPYNQQARYQPQYNRQPTQLSRLTSKQSQIDSPDA